MPIAVQEGNVTTADGVRGTFTTLSPQNGEHEPSIRLNFGTIPPVVVPASLLVHEQGETYKLSLRFKELAEADRIAAVIPLVSEQISVGKEAVVTGGVRVSKRVEHVTEVVDEPLFKEDVEIERVPVNRYLDAPAGIRQEGDATIIPLQEEALVVQKRLLLREELVIRKRRIETHEPQAVTLRREQAVVEPLQEGADSGDAEIKRKERAKKVRK